MALIPIEPSDSISYAAVLCDDSSILELLRQCEQLLPYRNYDMCMETTDMIGVDARSDHYLTFYNTANDTLLTTLEYAQQPTENWLSLLHKRQQLLYIAGETTRYLQADNIVEKFLELENSYGQVRLLLQVFIFPDNSVGTRLPNQYR